MKAELRLTDTNAASDSKGRTWGLEGSLFWWLVAGIGAGITLFFVLLVVIGSSLTVSFLVALTQTAIGRKLIQIYYNNFDSINAALDSSPALRRLPAELLEAVAPLVGKK